MDYSSFAETNTDATVQMLETPEAAIETATALHQEPDNNLLSGSDVMETTPSIFPAPVDAPETEFRPQLTELEALYEQGATMMYGMAEREEKRRREKQARLMDVLRAGAMDEEGRALGPRHSEPPGFGK